MGCCVCIQCCPCVVEDDYGPGTDPASLALDSPNRDTQEEARTPFVCDKPDNPNAQWVSPTSEHQGPGGMPFLGLSLATATSRVLIGDSSDRIVRLPGECKSRFLLQGGRYVSQESAMYPSYMTIEEITADLAKAASGMWVDPTCHHPDQC